MTDISVITFHGFTRDGERLLARQLEVEPRPTPKRRRRAPSVAEMRAALRNYLAASEYEALFDQVYSDIKGRLPARPAMSGMAFDPQCLGLSTP